MRWKIAGLLLFSLLCWEVIVRFFVVSPAVVVFDKDLGAMKSPHSSILRTYEGYSRFKTDQYGFNNDPLPSILPQRRILVLGDSFVEAEQVMRSDNFVSQLNRLPNTLVYNAGYSGADPRSFPILMDRFFKRLQPTQVVLCVNSEDLKALNTFKPPYYPTPTGLKAWLQPLFAHSALATHLNWKYKPVLESWEHHQHTHVVQVKKVDLSRLLQHWQEILVYLQQKKVPLLLLVMPNIRYVPYRVEVIASENTVGMVDVAKALHISVVNTNSFFVRDFEQTRLVALGFANSHLGAGHLNEVGHRIVTQAIVQILGLKQ